MAQVSKGNNAHVFSKLAYDHVKCFEMETSERSYCMGTLFVFMMKYPFILAFLRTF